MYISSIYALAHNMTFYYLICIFSKLHHFYVICPFVRTMKNARISLDVPSGR